MTINEAIKQLEVYKACFTLDYADVDALDMAIRSLEAWENVLKEIESHIDTIPRTRDIDFGQLIGLEASFLIINKHLKEVGK